MMNGGAWVWSWRHFPAAALVALPIFVTTGPGTDVTPIDSVTTSIASYILGYGVLGIVALAFAFRFIVPGKAVEKAREEARGDLARELERVIREKERAEEQRDDALRTSRDMIPILVQFTSASSSLIPLLQEIVSNRRGAVRERDARD